MVALTVPGELDVDAEGRREVLRRQGLLDRTGGQIGALGQQQHMRDALRDLLDMMGDHDRGRRPLRREDLRECAEQLLTPTEVESGRRLKIVKISRHMRENYEKIFILQLLIFYFYLFIFVLSEIYISGSYSCRQA